jgi:serine protease Do
VTDRPSLDVDDATSSYTPPRSERPRWVSQGWGTGQQPRPQTPEHWFDPATQGAAPHGSPISLEPAPSSRSDRSARGGVVAGMVLVSVLSATLAAGGTFGLLAAGGYLRSDGSQINQPPVQQISSPPIQNNYTVLENSAIIQASQAVSPAVVTITSRAAQNGINDPFRLPTTGIGSGIIYDARGLALTNRHVVCGADALTVKLADGREFEAEVYGTDTLTDLAIVQIAREGETLPVAGIGDSSALQPGQLAVAIGSPLGFYTNTTTSGVISATGREINVQDACDGDRERHLRGLIQTDAAINPGNSGGALVDSSGSVVGVNTAVAGSAQGIGFAIPINIAKPIMSQAVAGKDLTRPWIGVNYNPITPSLKDTLGLPINYGALVARPVGRNEEAVIPGSPAEQAGLKEGDIIRAVNDTTIDATHSLEDILIQYQPDQELTLDVLRDGQPITLTLVLGERLAEAG